MNLVSQWRAVNQILTLIKGFSETNKSRLLCNPPQWFFINKDQTSPHVLKLWLTAPMLINKNDNLYEFLNNHYGTFEQKLMYAAKGCKIWERNPGKVFTVRYMYTRIQLEYHFFVFVFARILFNKIHMFTYFDMSKLFKSWIVFKLITTYLTHPSILIYCPSLHLYVGLVIIIVFVFCGCFDSYIII